MLGLSQHARNRNAKERPAMKPLRLAACMLIVAPMAAVAAPPIAFQTTFDSIGPAVQALPGPGGRTIHFADTGEAGWRPVLYIGGTGTSARAFLMTGYLETLRRQLRLRLISVERNGFGDTAFDPGWGFTDYVAQVRAVLNHLRIGRFAMVAISGGGPYAGHIAASLPDRLISLHFAAALADVRGSGDALCKASPEAAAKALAPAVQNPQAWWAFPAASPTHAIPGFAERAQDEGARTFFIRGQMGDPRPEAAEMQRYCSDRLPDLRAVRAPVFTYYGSADPLVVPENGAHWRAAIAGPATARSYPGEGHDVQYRHWDQILIDLAGYGPRELVCRAGKSVLTATPRLDEPRGLCLWRTARR